MVFGSKIDITSYVLHPWNVYNRKFRLTLISVNLEWLLHNFHISMYFAVGSHRAVEIFIRNALQNESRKCFYVYCDDGPYSVGYDDEWPCGYDQNNSWLVKLTCMSLITSQTALNRNTRTDPLWHSVWQCWFFWNTG